MFLFDGFALHHLLQNLHLQLHFPSCISPLAFPLLQQNLLFLPQQNLLSKLLLNGIPTVWISFQNIIVGNIDSAARRIKGSGKTNGEGGEVWKIVDEAHLRVRRPLAVPSVQNTFLALACSCRISIWFITVGLCNWQSDRGQRGPGERDRSGIAYFTVAVRNMIAVEDNTSDSSPVQEPFSPIR
jgi:hypothetical protein